ncbi:MAG: response regulator transcription factor [Crocinitomicaceae bacterium]|nr:response regulator transcription factor [Crocinitomicaceae bacterium]
MDESVNKEITLTGENGLTAKVLPNERLSNKESQVTAGKGIGLSNQQIANVLHMAIDTVKTHLKNIYQKLEVNNGCAAVSMAITDGIIEVTRDAAKESPFKNGLLCLALFFLFLICPFTPSKGATPMQGEQIAGVVINRSSGRGRNRSSSKTGRKKDVDYTEDSINV